MYGNSPLALFQVDQTCVPSFRLFPCYFMVHGVVTTIDLSVSNSHRTQTSQWQSSISCTGSGTRTSFGFSAIEKHWKIRSLQRFYGVYASKMEKRCAWGTCNTDSRNPERMSNIIYFITFPESKQNTSKSIQPQYK